jgi:hypothetical protein
MTLGTACSAECVRPGTLDKKTSLSSVKARRSTKITAVSYRRLLTTLCRAPPFAECLALGKVFFAECLSVPRVLLSVNVVITESRNLPSAALDKEVFAECPTESTRQSVVHSAKSRIPVMDAMCHAKNLEQPNVVYFNIVEVNHTSLAAASNTFAQAPQILEHQQHNIST